MEEPFATHSKQPLMNKNFILFLLPVFFCAFTNAQVHWAVKAGAQTSYAGYKKDGNKISTQLITGFNAGIIAKVYFDDRVAFVSGLHYSVKGYKVQYVPAESIKKYRLNYIEIPVLLQFDLSKTAANGFYCKAGPSLGIGLGGKETYKESNGENRSNNLILSVTGNNFGLFDASLHAFAGYTFKKTFFTEVGYVYGIGNINNDMNGPVIKTRLLTVNIGCFFK
jgi:Outer membrane protein beta-barrel domain